MAKKKQKTEQFDKKAVLNKITPIIEKTAKDLDLILVETNLVQESGIWHLRVFIYSNDHAISHEDCKNMTIAFDENFDNLIPVNYCLEISSPGIDRKIKSSNEYNIFQNKNIKIKLKKELDNGLKNFEATIIDFNNNTLTLQLENDEKIEVEENNISSAKLNIKTE